ncbi:hypothetical protein LZ480_13935 [Solibacillus sp. MA9]|uniref:Uncharacterized protein n=1 Tax=Solibacillus palustris TaxID=2908203 RepID=A0ABS9UFW3_9BACL|nr:hypothetical protein [Solibacillus sp. MA9]MCH7322974.1 hypothetical protein [Solibacillus sp. MA9]
MSLSKSGYLTLFVGIILLVVSIFFTSGLNLTAWMILFIVSLILCTVGIIMLIIHLMRQIKEDKARKLQ